jgi:hypothetical protein
MQSLSKEFTEFLYSDLMRNDGLKLNWPELNFQPINLWNLPKNEVYKHSTINTVISLPISGKPKSRNNNK